MLRVPANNSILKYCKAVPKNVYEVQQAARIADDRSREAKRRLEALGESLRVRELRKRKRARLVREAGEIPQDNVMDISNKDHQESRRRRETVLGASVEQELVA